MTGAPHRPVLLEPAIELLQPAAGRRFLDGTFGYGGHTRRLLAAGAEVVGIDLDADAQSTCRDLATAETGLHCHHGSFRHLDEAAAAAGWTRVDGVLLDLGVNSHQIDDPGKGFSYRGGGPLDLRFDTSRGLPASDLVAAMDERELADLIFRWGEERRSRRLARAVVAARKEAPVDTTDRLAAVITAALPGGTPPSPVLSRVFQALRIAVNEELDALAEALADLAGILAPGGRAVVISYHSLEDRLVKRHFDRERRDCVCPPRLPVCTCGHRATLRPVVRGAMQAGDKEIAANPRARSARLRAVERI